jgi:elongation factor P
VWFLITTSEFRSGARVELESGPFEIVDYQHVKPGKGGSFVRTRLKNLKTGNILERTFRSGESLPEADVEEREMQFLYVQGEDFHFMDTGNYEQFSIPRDSLLDCFDLLKEGMAISLLFYKGRPLHAELPTFLELRIVQTDPGIKGDTATSGNKPAVLETGATVKVPLHIGEGEMIRIDSRTRSYVERVK